MFDSAAYDAERFHLAPGERLITYSDGITDCFDIDGNAFNLDHLCRLLAANRAQSSADLAELLRETVLGWRGDAELEDDVSLLIIERPSAAE